MTDAEGSSLDLEEARAFVAANATRKGPLCRMCALQIDVRMIAETLLSEGTTHRVVAAWLASRGHNVGYYTVGKHWREHVRD